MNIPENHRKNWYFFVRLFYSLSCFLFSNSDDNLLKNLELFDKLSLRFNKRVLFMKDVIVSNEICCWIFFGHGQKMAEVCCTSIVYGTDKKHTKVRLPFIPYWIEDSLWIHSNMHDYCQVLCTFIISFWSFLVIRFQNIFCDHLFEHRTHNCSWILSYNLRDDLKGSFFICGRIKRTAYVVADHLPVDTHEWYFWNYG